MIIVDTDILIDAGRNIKEAVTCLNQLEKNFSLAICSITQMELIAGCGNKKELSALELFGEHFQVLHVNEQISETATELLKHYRLSHGLLIPDALIAATSIAKGIPLISKNQRDYKFIKKLRLLPYPKPF
ncbi:MAG: type II toxin-antitoxin system VapC family toxin [Thermodesulfobacteriota bacterium]